MMKADDAGTAPHTAVRYRIRFAGLLAANWSEWFAGLSLNHEGGATVIEGELADQAALYGLLDRARDLGLPLLEVRRLTPEC